MSQAMPRPHCQPASPQPGQRVSVAWTVPPGFWRTPAAAQAATLVLTAEHIDTSESGALPREVWAERLEPQVMLIPEGGWRLQATFTLPEDALPTQARRGTVRAQWWVDLVDVSQAKRWRQALDVATPASWRPEAPRPSAWQPDNAAAAAHTERPVAERPEVPLPASVIQPLLWPGRSPAWVQRFPLGWRRLLGGLWLAPAAWGTWMAREAFASPGNFALLWTLAWLLLALVGWSLAIQTATREWVLGFAKGWVMCLRDGALWPARRAQPAYELRGLKLARAFEQNTRQGSKAHYRVKTDPRQGAAWVLSPGLGLLPVAEAVAAQLLRGWRKAAAQPLETRPPWLQLRVAADAAHGSPRLLRLLPWRLLWLMGVAAALAGMVPSELDNPNSVLPAWQERAERLSATSRQRAAMRVVLRKTDSQDLADLLAEGVSPDIRLDKGDTPLLRAARRGRLDQVDLLLRHGARPDLPDASEANQGDTPLLVALANGHEDVVQRLVQAGASWQVMNRAGWTPMHMAAQTDCLPCLEMARAAHVPLSARAMPSRGETPAMLAASRGRLQAVQWLVAQGVPLNDTDSQGKTALDWARRNGQTAVIQWLLARGAAYSPAPHASQVDGARR